MSEARKLDDYLKQRRARIDDALDRAIPPLGSSPAVLHEAMRHTLLAPGKRLRGVVVLASCEMLRGPVDDALTLACAAEMVHASSLILDDLPAMDDATLRRGKLALHCAVGEANAILAAVALLNGAFGLIVQLEGIRDRLRRDLLARLSWAIGADGLIGGQIVDLASTGQSLDLDALEYIHSHKTGALFIAAAQMGAVISRARSGEMAALTRWAKNLGLAFQITDDLLDYSGDPERLGKDVGKDRNKTTFVELCGIAGARRLVDELIDHSQSALSTFGRRGATLSALSEFVRGRDR